MLPRGAGGLAQFGQEFADAAGDRGVALGFAGPAAFGGILDQLLFDLEAVSQPGAAFAGGAELRAAQVEIALAGPSAEVRRQ